MNAITELLSNRLVWEAIGGYWLFSAAIGAMPTPEQGGSRWYQFVFRFGHALAGNVSRAAVALKVPGAQDQPPTP